MTAVEVVVHHIAGPVGDSTLFRSRWFGGRRVLVIAVSAGDHDSIVKWSVAVMCVVVREDAT